MRELVRGSRISRLKRMHSARPGASGSSRIRFPERSLIEKACMDYLRAEDTLVIYRLNRLARSVKEMLDLCVQLESRRIKLVSLQDNLDTTTAVGRFTMQILASLAEYNRNLILEECKAGIEAA